MKTALLTVVIGLMVSVTGHAECALQAALKANGLRGETRNIWRPNSTAQNNQGTPKPVAPANVNRTF